MSIRIDHTVVTQIYDDTDRKDCLFSPSAALAKVTLDGFQRCTSGKFSIAPAASESLAFGDVTTVAGYYLELQPEGATKNIPPAQINVNALGLRPITPGATTGVTAKSFHEGLITSVVLQNDAAGGGDALVGRYVVWGDPAP